MTCEVQKYLYLKEFIQELRTMFLGSKRLQLMELAQRQATVNLHQDLQKKLRKEVVQEEEEGGVKERNQKIGKKIKRIQRRTFDRGEGGDLGKNAKGIESLSELY